MKDEAKTREQLISELNELRQQVAELEASKGEGVQQTAALRQQMQYMRAALESIGDGIIVVNTRGEFMLFNHAAEQILGIGATRTKPDEWPAQYGIFMPDKVTPMPSDDLPLARALGGESVENVEAFVRNSAIPDGIYITASAHPLDGYGVSGGVVVFRDITERRRMQESLRLSEERYRLLAENFPNSAIIVLDHNLRFVLVDGPEVEATGFSKEALEGKTLYEALPAEFVQVVEPNIRAALSGKHFTAELPWEEGRYYLYSYVPLKNKAGEVVLAMILAQNITERKLAQEALRQSEEDLRAMLNATHDLALMMDADGKLLVVNERLAESMGTTVKEMTGKNMRDVLPPDLAQTRLASLQEVFATGKPLHFEDQNRGRIFDNIVYPITDQNDMVDRLAVFIRDVTVRKQAEGQQIELAIQRERVRLLEDLVSDLSHDIKTPLASIKTFTYLLKKQSDPESQQQYLDKLETQVERLTKLVEDILAMAQLDKGAELLFAPVTLNDLVQDIDAGLRHLIDEKRIALNFDLSTDLPFIIGSETELNRAFTNLIGNAANYTPSGGSITVRTYAQSQNITVEIHDTGIGINQSDLPRIFDRFYRADKARNAKQGGTGLGLAIVKKIIELHGGEIEVESRPGIGSTFSVRLPIVQQF